MTEFCFIRHGSADFSEMGRKFYKNEGSFMCTLSEKGIEQAKNAAKDERLKGADLIITSPFGRALHTAAILSKELTVDIKVETDLHEWFADVWEYSYLDNETACRNYDEFRDNKGKYPDGVNKQWESADMLKERVSKVLDKYKYYKKVIVVCHGVLMEYFLNIEHPSNCDIFLYRR